MRFQGRVVTRRLKKTLVVAVCSGSCGLRVSMSFGSKKQDGSSPRTSPAVVVGERAAAAAGIAVATAAALAFHRPLATQGPHELRLVVDLRKRPVAHVAATDGGVEQVDTGSHVAFRVDADEGAAGLTAEATQPQRAPGEAEAGGVRRGEERACS